MIVQKLITKTALVQAKFKVNIDTFKILAANILIGDVNAIDYNSFDKATLKFKDELFGVFFWLITAFKARTMIQMRISTTYSTTPMLQQA
jgi:hypothetical protein